MIRADTGVCPYRCGASIAHSEVQRYGLFLRLPKEFKNFNRNQLVHAKHAISTGGGGAIADEFLAGIATGNNASIVQVVLPLTGLTGGDAVGGYLQGIAADGNTRVVVAVRALAVEGVEHWWVGKHAKAHDETIVHAKHKCAPRVDGIEDALGGCLLTTDEPEVLCTAVVGKCDCGEHTGVGRHRCRQRGVLVHVIVDNKIAPMTRELVLRVATPPKHAKT